MEIILGITNIALLVALFYKDKTAKEERNQFITALLAKTPEEFAVATKIVESKPQEEQKPPEFIPEGELSDDDFFKTIAKNNA